MSKANGAIGPRLQAALRAGNLRISDLARWFNAPYPTMRAWVNEEFSPRLPPVEHAEFEEALDMLEHKIRKKQGFPVPRLSPANRIAHLEKLRAGR